MARGRRRRSGHHRPPKLTRWQKLSKPTKLILLIITLGILWLVYRRLSSNQTSTVGLGSTTTNPQYRTKSAKQTSYQAVHAATRQPSRAAAINRFATEHALDNLARNEAIIARYSKPTRCDVPNEFDWVINSKDDISVYQKQYQNDGPCPESPEALALNQALAEREILFDQLVQSLRTFSPTHLKSEHKYQLAKKITTHFPVLNANAKAALGETISIRMLLDNVADRLSRQRTSKALTEAQEIREILTSSWQDPQSQQTQYFTRGKNERHEYHNSLNADRERCDDLTNTIEARPPSWCNSIQSDPNEYGNERQMKRADKPY